MQLLSSRILRTVASSSSSLTTLPNHASSTCVVPKQSFSALSLQPNLQKLQERAIPGDFVKWGSLGFYRTLSFATGFTPLQQKPLDSIMDIERVKDRSPEDITSIWDDDARFLIYLLVSIIMFWSALSNEASFMIPSSITWEEAHIGASMTAKLYFLMEQRAADCRYFVIPLWKGSGFTTMFAQVQMPHMIFTGLEDYKARGTQAAPYFTVSYYKEFAESKDLVLIRGDVVYKLVERFNKETHDFEFKDVLQALDMPS
ncbi:hypothetical protein SLA2020_411260 [Shorea laevis]